MDHTNGYTHSDVDDDEDQVTGVTLRKHTNNFQESQERLTRSKSGSRSMLLTGCDGSISMLSCCLDDIHSFGKRLNRCIDYGNQDRMTLLPVKEKKIPSLQAAKDCVHKIKFCLNLARDLEEEAPEAAAKVFVRLIKFVGWLDLICSQRVVPQYDERLLKDVVSPLLSEATLSSIRNHLTGDAVTFWKDLGPAWNTPREEWKDPVSPYLPYMKVNNRTLSPDLYKYMTSESRNTLRASTIPQSPTDLVDRSQKVITKEQAPRIRNKDHERFYLKAQERGAQLCFATVRHMAATEYELNASRGELFEILNSEDDEYWTVENHSGETGKIPFWKLQRTYITNFTTNGKYPELYRKSTGSIINSQFSQRTYANRPYSMTRRSDAFYNQPEYNRRSFNPREVTMRSRSLGSYLNIPSAVSELDNRTRPVSAFQPLVIYWPTDQGGKVSNHYSTLPMVMMPHPSTMTNRNRSQHSSPSRPSSRASPRRFDDNVFPFPEEELPPQTPLTPDIDHPHLAFPYQPRIDLNKRPFGKKSES